MKRAWKIVNGSLAVALFTIYTVLLIPLFLTLDFLDWVSDDAYSKNVKYLWRKCNSASTERGE